MISICTIFYPWWRQYDRTEEIFDALIGSMNKCKDKHLLELSVIDGGVLDVWGRREKREHDVVKFEERLRNKWKGKLKYSLDDTVIHYRSKGRKSFWVARAIDLAVKQASYEKILTIGIDCELPSNIIEVINNWVDPGKVLVLHCFHIRRDFPRVHKPYFGGWRSANGITAIMKKDYLAVGGSEKTGMIKDKSDSLRYKKLKKTYNLKEIRAVGLFHVDHPGCNERRSEFKGNWKKEEDMRICVAGWHGNKMFYDFLEMVPYGVTVINHKEDNDCLSLLKVNVPNIGLEFGCYDYYLKNIWKGGNVLFIHDDTDIKSPGVLDSIFKLKHDCAYLFRDKAEEKANGGKHGRAIYCSDRFLRFIKDFKCSCIWLEEKEDVHHNKGTFLPSLGKYHTGFFYDLHNEGHVSGKPPVGIRHYNEAIYHFHWMLGRIRDQRCGDREDWPCPDFKMDVVNRIFLKDLVAGRRNSWRHIEREQEVYGT